MRKLVTILLIVCFGTFMFLAGRQLGRDHQTRPQVKVVEVPHYISSKDKVTEKKVMPQVCRDAATWAVRMQKATDAYEEAVGGLPDLIDSAGVALHNNDRKKLNELREKQVKLEADSIDSLLALREAKQRLDSLNAKCDKEIK